MGLACSAERKDIPQRCPGARRVPVALYGDTGGEGDLKNPAAIASGFFHPYRIKHAYSRSLTLEASFEECACCGIQ